MTLTNHLRQAASGKPDNLVVFLHGYGADGKDLLGLSDILKQGLPNTLFISPDAPNSCTLNPMGYEWFPIPRFDGSSLIEAAIGRDKSAVILNKFLDKISTDTGISAERTFLMGFSQGCMMSLHIAPRRIKMLAGVIGISGMLIEPERLLNETLQRPPVLLVHGDEDDVVPFEEMGKANDALINSGFKVLTLRSKGTSHGIAQDGLNAAANFIKKNL